MEHNYTSQKECDCNKHCGTEFCLLALLEKHKSKFKKYIAGKGELNMAEIADIYNTARESIIKNSKFRFTGVVFEAKGYLYKTIHSKTISFLKKRNKEFPLSFISDSSEYQDTLITSSVYSFIALEGNFEGKRHERLLAVIDVYKEIWNFFGWKSEFLEDPSNKKKKAFFNIQANKIRERLENEKGLLKELLLYLQDKFPTIDFSELLRDL